MKLEALLTSINSAQWASPETKAIAIKLVDIAVCVRQVEWQRRRRHGSEPAMCELEAAINLVLEIDPLEEST